MGAVMRAHCNVAFHDLETRTKYTTDSDAHDMTGK